MIKYILFFVALVCFVLNFTSKKLLTAFFKKEITEKQEIVLKACLYIVMLSCTIGIFVFCR